jgi:hypothetical protein
MVRAATWTVRVFETATALLGSAEPTMNVGVGGEDTPARIATTMLTVPALGSGSGSEQGAADEHVTKAPHCRPSTYGNTGTGTSLEQFSDSCTLRPIATDVLAALSDRVGDAAATAAAAKRTRKMHIENCDLGYLPKAGVFTERR